MTAHRAAHDHERPALVFDLGGTNVRAAIADPHDGMLLVTERRATCNFITHPDLDADELLAGTVEEMRAAAAFLLGGRSPCAVVCGWPGPIAPSGTIIRSPTILGPIHDRAFDALPAMRRIWGGCPMAVQNDLTCAGYAYVGAGWRDFCILTVGSGIANKVFVDSRPILGPQGRGGEVGHVAAWLPNEFPRQLTRSNISLGDLSSGRGALSLARELAHVARGSVPPPGEAMTSEELVQAFHCGAEVAQQVIRLVVTPVAHMIASIHGSVGTETFAITGGFATALGEPYRRMIVETVPDLVWDLGQDWDRMIFLGEDADGLAGAAVYAVREMLPRD